MSEIIDFIKEYAVFYAIPFYVVCVFYVMLLLGWFFSTDYYDSIYESFDTGDDDFHVVHITCLIIIAIESCAIYFGGIQCNGSLILNSLLWVFLGAPALYTLRLYLRQKRGKL